MFTADTHVFLYFKIPVIVVSYYVVLKVSLHGRAGAIVPQSHTAMYAVTARSVLLNLIQIPIRVRYSLLSLLYMYLGPS